MKVRFLSGSTLQPDPAQHGSTYGLIVDRADLKNQTFDEYVAGLPNQVADFTNGASWAGLSTGVTDNGDGTLTIADVGGVDGNLSFQTTNNVGDWVYLSVNITATDAVNMVFKERNSSAGGTPLGSASFGEADRFTAIYKAGYENSHFSFQVVTADTSATIDSFEIKVIPATIWTAPSTEGSPTLAREVPGVLRNRLLHTEDLTNGVWLRGGGTLIELSAEVGPNGGAAFELTGSAADSNVFQAVSATRRRNTHRANHS
jgi:hypothetical protein